jgi:hypothetical protein
MTASPDRSCLIRGRSDDDPVARRRSRPAFRFALSAGVGAAGPSVRSMLRAAPCAREKVPDMITFALTAAV